MSESEVDLIPTARAYLPLMQRKRSLRSGLLAADRHALRLHVGRHPRSRTRSSSLGFAPLAWTSLPSAAALIESASLHPRATATRACRCPPNRAATRATRLAFGRRAHGALRKHAERRPGAISMSGGADSRHLGMTYGQRG